MLKIRLKLKRQSDFSFPHVESWGWFTSSHKEEEKKAPFPTKSCSVSLTPDNSSSVLQGAAEELERCLFLSRLSGDRWGEWIERTQRRSGCSHSLEVCLQADEHHSETEANDESEGAEKGENKRWKGWQWCTAAEQDTEDFGMQRWLLTLSWKTFTEKDTLLADWHLSEIYKCIKPPHQNIKFSP